jgi:hypothetical protein
MEPLRSAVRAVFGMPSDRSNNRRRASDRPATDMVEVSRPSWDRWGMSSVIFSTRSDGTIKVTRFQNLFNLMTELRRTNPELRVTNL